MDFKYWFRFLMGIYGWLVGFYALLLLGLFELHREGVQANYRSFILLWGAFILVSPFFLSKYGGGLPDPKLLFPRYSMAAGLLLTLGLYVVTSIIGASILFWVIDTFNI